MYRHYIKRVLDFMFALYLILPITLIVAVYALLIKLEDGGPAFYIEKRVGKYGRTFKTYILRSTKVDADDPQLTKIGRFIRKSGIDELPQIFNVLLGNMSFIGPRPDLLDNSRCYALDEIRRLQTWPGIEGITSNCKTTSIMQKMFHFGWI
ncbi:MAG TPA: sugar transferase [Clostridia bacterium]|nr:sugar transferase [Clostridia bacterium]